MAVSGTDRVDVSLPVVTKWRGDLLPAAARGQSPPRTVWGDSHAKCSRYSLAAGPATCGAVSGLFISPFSLFNAESLSNF